MSSAAAIQLDPPRASLRTPAPRVRTSPLKSLLLSAGVTLAAGRGVAHAQPGSVCSEQRLRVEGTLSPQWLEPVVQLCESLGSMPDIDPSAQLRVVGAGEDVIVEVTLGDGRSTLRRVRTPSDLPLTVEALVAVPPAPTSTPAATALPADPPALPMASVTPAVRPRSSEARPALPSPPLQRISLEAGGSLMGRVAGNPIYLSLGLTGYVGVRSGPWLLAATARWDGYQTVLDERPVDFEMFTAGGGFQILRRLLTVRDTALESGVTAWLLGETQAFEAGVKEHAGSIIDVRLGTLSRMVFGKGPLHWTASVDAELSPSRLQRSLHIAQGLPLLPAWSVGLGGGIAWDGP